MRLVIDVPAGIDVTCSPPRIAPANLKTWIDGLLGGAHVARTTDARTRHGWPVRILEAHTRVIAVYLFLEHAASATVSGADLEARRDEVMAMLLAASPDWRGDEVVALADLWDLKELPLSPPSAG
jgi:hypothetical protein